MPFVSKRYERRFGLSVIFLLTLTISLASAGDADSFTTVKPKATTDPVVNPGKGWVSFGHVEGKAKAEIDLISIGYRRFDWSAIQPKEDEFNWKVIDDYIESWGKHGKKVAFGIMAANTHSSAKDGYVTPKWVFDAGVPMSVKTIRGQKSTPKGRPGTYRHPQNFHHPLFLEKVDAFVKAMAERYDGHDAIAFIDVRTFQNWGEGHSSRHVDIHAAHFKKTRLCQSVHGGNAPRRAKELAEKGIAVRRDGIGGSKGKEVAPAAGLTPAIFEFWGSLDFLKSRGWWKEGALVKEAIEIGKPTYVEFIRGSSEALLTDYRPVVDAVTNRIGFHFVLQEARFPKQIKSGEPVEIRLKWTNTGVSKIFVTCLPRLALIDENGRIVAHAKLNGSDPHTWLPDKQVAEVASATFEGTNLNGTYRLAIGLFESEKHDQPTICLGIDTPIINGWHVLGPIAVTKAGGEKSARY